MANQQILNPSLGAYNNNNSWLGTAFGFGYGDQQRDQLAQNGYNQSALGASLANNYAQNQAGINGTIGGLQAIANGQNSVSAEQLRQGLQQAQAQQMSAAASANPAAGPGAARTAMMQMGQQASGMMGQQAVAGLQERQNAYNALGQLQIGQSGQNLQGALGGYNGANGSLGTYLQNKPQTALGVVAGGIGGVLGGALGGS